ncbi:hypothetical protein [uncultured Rikenella sp.]|uniref:hypothetical protein n=1 Tax=uncultured Rikenella sp. TaxID=368003 RepID=UPI002622A1BC|nr:hypothetical protein [uncultured Rikenella sp.]
MNLEKKVNKIEKRVENEVSVAMDILNDYKKQNKRLFIIILVLCAMLTAVTCYTIYLLNDIEVVETTETIEDYDVSQNSGDGGNNNFINGNENEVNN